MKLRPSDRVQVMVACNNSRGLNRGYFECIEVHRLDGAMVRLLCPPTVVREHWASGRIASIRLSTRLMACMGYAHHVGNLCWNSYVVHRLRVLPVLEGLMRRGANAEECAGAKGDSEVCLADWWKLFTETAGQAEPHRPEACATGEKA